MGVTAVSGGGRVGQVGRGLTWRHPVGCTYSLDLGVFFGFVWISIDFESFSRFPSSYLGSQWSPLLTYVFLKVSTRFRCFPFLSLRNKSNPQKSCYVKPVCSLCFQKACMLWSTPHFRQSSSGLGASVLAPGGAGRGRGRWRPLPANNKSHSLRGQHRSA